MSTESLKNSRIVVISLLVLLTLLYVGSLWMGLKEQVSTIVAISHSAATGLLIEGQKTRSFDGKLMCSWTQFRAREYHAKSKTVFSSDDSSSKMKTCPHWAVVTTINKPSESIRRVVELTKKSRIEYEWCVVIVGDTQTPNELFTGNNESIATSSSNVVYLSTNDQEKIHHEFVQAIPYRSFARKNIGYLYAIVHGAQAIFDFDDDNVLKPDTVPYEWHQGSRQVLFRYLPQQEQDKLAKQKTPAFNPFPVMMPTENNTWPRGFPIQYVQNEEAYPDLAFGSLPSTSIGVIQSTCDGDPDVDAIYRLTRHLPFTFNNKREASTFLIPPDSYSPYNAQATVHTKQAFWGLLLPFTVTGRVTDIWRSYFTQRIMKDLHLALLYSPPMVDHIRNDHNYLADLQSEADLYYKSAALLEFLKEWNDEETFLPARIEKLAVALYEHEYIDLPDVQAMQLWLLVLRDVGYEFPALPTNSTGDDFAMSELTEQPSLRGQPFLARPLYNVDTEGQTYREYMLLNNNMGSDEAWEQWKSQLQLPTNTDTSQSTSSIAGKRITRPSSLILKIVMMTKDEWPLLKHWVVYHGELLGFENLYIIDDSSDPQCTAFLRHARDHWGVNVVFSTADLNQLAAEMSSIGELIQGSSDLMMKMDTDEFIVVNHPTGTDVKHCVDLSNCTLSPYAVRDFLEDFEYWDLSAHGQPLSALYLSLSHPNRTLCDQGRGDDVAQFPLEKVSNLEFKAVSDSRSFRGFDLGGHGGQFHQPMASWTRDRVRIGIIHVHHRCYHHEVSNSRKAVLSHHYIDASESEQEALQHLLRDYVGPQGACNITEPGQMKVAGNSYHKVLSYAKSLECPEQNKEEYYQGNKLYPMIDETSSTMVNSEFAQYMDNALLKHDWE